MQARHARGGRGVLDLTPEHAAEVQHIIGGGGIGIWSPVPGVLKVRTANANTTQTCNARYRSSRRLRRTTTTTKRATRTTKTSTPELQLWSHSCFPCARVSSAYFNFIISCFSISLFFHQL
jgi:hypothetical protein